MNKRAQQGFTLIELVVVILILGIMAAIAVPKFVDISSDAHTAAGKSVAAAISSGSSINYATRTANSNKGTAVSAANVCTTAILGGMLTGTSAKLVTAAPTTDDEFQVTASSGPGTNVDCSAGAATAQCNITPKGTGVAVATATLICVQ